MKSLLYDTPYARVTQAGVDLAVELYSTDLEVFAHRRLPRFSRSSSFHSRADAAYLYLARHCPYLHTVMARQGPDSLDTPTNELVKHGCLLCDCVLVQGAAILRYGPSTGLHSKEPSLPPPPPQCDHPQVQKEGKHTSQT